MTRTTGALATLFFVSSMALAYLGGQQRPSESLLESTAPDAPAVVGTPVDKQSVAVDNDYLPDLPGSLNMMGPADSETVVPERSE